MLAVVRTAAASPGPGPESSVHREAVREILRLLTIRPDGVVMVADQVVALPAPAPGGGVAGGRVGALQQFLYARAYCHRLNVPERAAVPEGDLSALLMQANASRDQWQEGWQVVSLLPSGALLAQRAGEERKLWPGSFVSLGGPGVPPQPGMFLRVYSARESLTAQPGFYFAFGESWYNAEEYLGLLRVYWNVQAQGAPKLLKVLTKGLNRYGVPFQFKCLLNAAQYTRLDSAVLYVAQRYAHLLEDLLPELREQVADVLGPEVPLFTRALGPGMALAEDPGTGESFGMNRCARLAEGLWAAHDLGLRDEESRLAQVERAFQHHGLKLDQAELRARPNPAAQGRLTA